MKVHHAGVAVLILLVLVIGVHGQAPRPVRNAAAQPARELLVLRHHQLRLGGHEEFYRLSAENVWPFFERNGARIVGQWKITDSAGTMTPGSDDVYRLVRYAGFEHWLATRSQRSSGGAAGVAATGLRSRDRLAAMPAAASSSKARGGRIFSKA
jgi:hypothetical protein